MQLTTINSIRWFARIFGAFLLLILVVFAIGEGIPDFRTVQSDVLLEFVGTLFMGIGVILAFKWELPGGLITIGGYLLFAVVEKNIFPGPIFPAFFVVGVLNLLYWWNFRKFNKF